MPKKLEQLDLRADKIVDENTRDSFQGLEEYLQGQVILQGQWEFFELDFTEAVSNFKWPHQFNFVPQDVILTGSQGDQRFTFNFELFDFTNLDITVQGPVKLRFLAGRYEDNRERTIKDPYTTVSGGGAATSHSVLTDLANDDHLQYLTEGRHDALPADNPHSVTFTQSVTADPGTDITAPEAEQLTDGSNADSLHTHTFPTVGEVKKLMDCAASVAINDWVYQSAATNNLAVKNTNDTEVEPTIGIVCAKPTSTTCEVLLLGLYSGLTLVGRGKIYMGSSGTATMTAPTSGTGVFLRQLGINFGDGTIYVNPEKIGLEFDDG